MKAVDKKDNFGPILPENKKILQNRIVNVGGRRNFSNKNVNYEHESPTNIPMYADTNFVQFVDKKTNIHENIQEKPLKLGKAQSLQTLQPRKFDEMNGLNAANQPKPREAYNNYYNYDTKPYNYARFDDSSKGSPKRASKSPKSCEKNSPENKFVLYF